MQEDYVAEDRPATHVEDRKVDACDVVVASFAQRYGSVPDGEPHSKSYSWLECERAGEIRPFLVDENAEWPQAINETYSLRKAIKDGTLTPELGAQAGRESQAREMSY